MEQDKVEGSGVSAEERVEAEDDRAEYSGNYTDNNKIGVKACSILVQAKLPLEVLDLCTYAIY